MSFKTPFYDGCNNYYYYVLLCNDGQMYCWVLRMGFYSMWCYFPWAWTCYIHIKRLLLLLHISTTTTPLVLQESLSKERKKV